MSNVRKPHRSRRTGRRDRGGCGRQFPADKRYGAADIGCHANGHDHRHVRLAIAGIMLRTFPPSELEHAQAMALHSELLDEPGDDFADEDRALDLINTRCDGVGFGLLDGDLLCLTVESWEREDNR